MVTFSKSNLMIELLLVDLVELPEPAAATTPTIINKKKDIIQNKMIPTKVANTFFKKFILHCVLYFNSLVCRYRQMLH